MNREGNKRKLEEMFSENVDEGNDEQSEKRIRLLSVDAPPALNSPLLPSADMAVLFGKHPDCSSCSNDPLPEVQTNVLSTSEVIDELECIICRETFLKPYTLQCSHTFCKKCINTWMKVRKSCPTCRKLLTRQPVYNMTLDKILRLVLKKMKFQEQEDMDRRRLELEKEEADALQRFITTVKSAKERGVVFLNISNPWNDNERLLFKTGVERYEGTARKLYCELTNFSLDFIKNATTEQLEVGCKNLGFLIPKVIGSNPTTDFNLIRMILTDFLST
ncbi:hypothetical protein AKO1_013646 [Acrasis kona]|uniref:RING-type domain-containing protein n=1 Tax=Acrasis kona TaxID=1008807 RepID=A0AAW2YU82_9EUKA